MKIIRGDEVFIQKYDLRFLSRGHMGMPDEICNAFSTMAYCAEDVDEDTFIKVINSDLADYVKKEEDWIMDFDEIKHLSYREAKRMHRTIYSEYCALLDRMIDTDCTNRKEHDQLFKRQYWTAQLEHFIQGHKRKIFQNWELLWKLPA